MPDHEATHSQPTRDSLTECPPTAAPVVEAPCSICNGRRMIGIPGEPCPFCKIEAICATTSTRKGAEVQAVASPAEEVAPVAWRWFAYGCWQVTHDQELAKEIAKMGNTVEPLYAISGEAEQQKCSHCNGRRLLPWRDGSWTMPCPWCAKRDDQVEKAAEEVRVLAGTVTGSFPSWVHAKIIAAIDRLAALVQEQPRQPDSIGSARKSADEGRADQAVALQADAARYRWLREQHEGCEPLSLDADGLPMPLTPTALAFTVFMPERGSLEPVGCIPGELDAAIDAAMSVQPKEA